MVRRENIGQVTLVTVFLVVSWVIVYETNGASDIFVYCFFISVILGAWFWKVIGGVVTGSIAGLLAGALMPMRVHPYVAQNDVYWLARLIVFVILGVFVGYVVEQMDKQHTEIVRQKETLEQFGTELIHTLAHTIELRDPYTNGHCRRVAEMSRRIGEKMGLSTEELLHLHWSALIHDIGKIAIPEHILNKPGKLSDHEYNVVKQHPVLGEWVLRETTYGHLLRDGVLSHHERWDGNGYPHGLREGEIPLQGRIIAVADVWDAISSKRPYRDGLPRERCIRIMREGRGVEFDPNILDIFLDCIAGEYTEEEGTACGS